MSARWAMPESPIRVRYKYRSWVGKPDPSGFSWAEVYFTDARSAKAYAEKLATQGHGSITIQTRPPDVRPEEPR